MRSVRRFFSLIVSVTMLLGVCNYTGCGKRNNSIVIDGYEFRFTQKDAEKLWGDDAEHTVVITEIANEEIKFKCDLPQEERTVDYFGTDIVMSYAGAYYYTGDNELCYALTRGHHDLDEYAYVYINAETGKIFKAGVRNISLKPVFGMITTADELLAAAEAFMRIQDFNTDGYKCIYSPFIGLTNQMLCTMTEEDSVFESGATHTVYYSQSIGDLPTDSLYQVTITADGRITHFCTKTGADYGLYPELKIDKEDYTEALYKLLSDLGGRLISKEKISFEIVRDSNGTPMLCATVPNFSRYTSLWNKINGKSEDLGVIRVYTPLETV